MWILFQKSENLGEIGQKWASPKKKKFMLSFLNIDLDLGWILIPSWLPCHLEQPWPVLQRWMPAELCLTPHLSLADTSRNNTRGFTCSFPEQILSVFLHLGTGASPSRDAQARNSRAEHQPVPDQFSCSSFLWLLPVVLMAISSCTAFPMMQGGYFFFFWDAGSSKLKGGSTGKKKS